MKNVAESKNESTPASEPRPVEAATKATTWPETPYERLCCVTSTVEVLADALDDDGTNTSNILRLMVRELDSIKDEVCEAEGRAEKEAADDKPIKLVPSAPPKSDLYAAENHIAGVRVVAELLERIFGDEGGDVQIHSSERLDIHNCVRVLREAADMLSETIS